MTVKRVEAYSIYDFAKAMQEAILAGYRVDESSDNFPQQFGTLFTAGLVPVVEAVKVVAEATQQVANATKQVSEAVQQAVETVSTVGAVNAVEEKPKRGK